MLKQIALSTLLCCSAVSSSSGVFETPDGRTVQDLDKTWELLTSFYGDSMPPAIILDRKDFSDDTSKFNCASRTIFLSAKITGRKKTAALAAHEGSHIALCALTREFNLAEESRFWDEGLATIFEFRSLGLEPVYRERALALAKAQAEAGNLSFAKIQNWKNYSRDSQGRINSYAYAVGSSFIFFIIESYGEEKLKEFLSSLAETSEFSKSAALVFDLPAMELERRWLAYLVAATDSANGNRPQ